MIIPTLAADPIVSTKRLSSMKRVAKRANLNDDSPQILLYQSSLQIPIYTTTITLHVTPPTLVPPETIPLVRPPSPPFQLKSLLRRYVRLLKKILLLLAPSFARPINPSPGSVQDYSPQFNIVYISLIPVVCTRVVVWGARMRRRGLIR